MAIVFALITSIGFGSAAYFIKKGMIEDPYPLVATFLSLTINIAFFILLYLIFVPIHFFKLNLIYLFIIAGTLAPGCVRLFYYKSIEILGLTISVSIVNSGSLFSVLLALIFLKEPMNLKIGAGILSVVSGLVILSYETGKKNKRDFTKKNKYRYLFYPLMASIFYGVSFFIRKLGLNVVNSPIMGATFTSGTSWCIIAILFSLSGSAKSLLKVNKNSLAYFFMAGVATCIAWLSLFYALNIGRVTIVTPIASSHSFATLLLSYVLLRNTEKITLQIVIATILIVGGIILLSLVK